jgi:hypothetical protein
MALNVDALADDLEDAFASLPATASDAADAIAQCYYDYTAGGAFGASLPTITPAMRDAMAATLLVAIATPATGSPAAFGAAIAAAVTTYWTAVPVTGAQAGATIPPPGAATLPAALAAVVANLGNTVATCAAAMAAALHAATLTTTAAVSPPPGTVLPLL